MTPALSAQVILKYWSHRCTNLLPPILKDVFGMKDGQSSDLKKASQDIRLFVKI